MASSAQYFGPMAPWVGMRDERPVPRWSNRITRPNEASRRWKRYSDGSESIEVDRDDRPGQHEQVDRAIAENLIGDVYVAASGVAGSRSLRHTLRLDQSPYKNTLACKREQAVLGQLDQPVHQ